MICGRASRSPQTNVSPYSDLIRAKLPQEFQFKLSSRLLASFRTSPAGRIDCQEKYQYPLRELTAAPDSQGSLDHSHSLQCISNIELAGTCLSLASEIAYLVWLPLAKSSPPLLKNFIDVNARDFPTVEHQQYLSTSRVTLAYIYHILLPAML